MKQRWFIILFIFTTICSYSQEDVVEKLLVNQYPVKESFVADGVWMYYGNNLEELNLPFFLLNYPHLKFYKAKLTNWLGYHVNESECLVIYNVGILNVQMIEPLWYSGINTNLTSNLLGLKLETRDHNNQFLKDFQKVLLVGSNEIISNSKVEDAYLSFNLTRNPQNGVYRTIKIIKENDIILRIESHQPSE